MATFPKIDGSMLEGGGQILRNAAALSAITGQAVEVERVRAKRTRPGLQPQHLAGLRLVEGICGGRLEGGAVGSSRVVLQPDRPVCGRYQADTKTAGSCTLMAQASMPVCLFATPPPSPSPGMKDASGSASVHADGRKHRRSSDDVSTGEHHSPHAVTELELKGGTDAEMAPPAGYLSDVLAPLLKRLYGDLLADLEVELTCRGFYPRGGGVLNLRVPALPPATALPPLNLTERGNVTMVGIHAFAAGRLPVTVAHRMAAAAETAVRKGLRSELGSAAAHRVQVVAEAVLEPRERAFGDGCGILIFADTDTGCRLGASAKGERGVPAERIGEAAAEELLEALASGACVDQWMQDQLVIWMALAKGTSRMSCTEPTLHTRTAMVVAERLLPGVKFVLHRPGGGGKVAAAEVAEGGGTAAAGDRMGEGSTAAGGHGSRRGGGRGGGRERRSGGGGGGGGGGSRGTAGGGLWLVECHGAGWVVGQTMEQEPAGRLEAECATETCTARGCVGAPAGVAELGVGGR